MTTDDLSRRRTRKLLPPSMATNEKLIGRGIAGVAAPGNPHEDLNRLRKAVRIAMAADALARVDPSRRWELSEVLAAAGYDQASSETIRLATDLLEEMAEVVGRAVEVARQVRSSSEDLP